MKKLVGFAVLLLFIGLSCKPIFNNQFTVSGEIQGAAGKELKLMEFTNTQVITIDSVVLAENGAFELKANTAQPTVFVLNLDGRLIPFLAENGNEVEVRADINTYDKAYEIYGSAGSEALKSFFGAFNAFQENVNQLNVFIEPYVNTPQFDSVRVIAQTRYEALEAKQREFVYDFFKKTDETVVPIYAILFAGGFISPENDYAWYEARLAQFETSHPRSKYTAYLKKFMEPYAAQANLQIGKPAPDFSLKTPEGKSLKLSDLRGKYILIDFWASWCAPCRKENPNVVRLHNRFKDKGFDILGVSLDRDSTAWVKAIKDDQLNWPQVSDLKYWDSQAAGLYNITGIPATYLIDPKGVIVGRNLRGQELEAKLESLLN